MQLVAPSTGIRQKLSEYKAKLAMLMPLQSAHLFGSHAKGGVSEHSDIDVLIVLYEKDVKKIFKYGSLCWRIARDIDVDIEPKVVSAEKFARPPEGSILAEIKRSAIEIE